MGFIVLFTLDVIVTSLIMYVAAKLSFVKAELKQLFGTVVVSLISIIGWIASFAVFVFLLMRVTNSDLMDCFWVVAFTKLITLGLAVVVGSAFA